MVCTCLCFPFFLVLLCFVCNPRGERISWGHFQERMMLVCLESSMSQREMKNDITDSFIHADSSNLSELVGTPSALRFPLGSRAAKTVSIVQMVLRQLLHDQQRNLCFSSFSTTTPPKRWKQKPKMIHRSGGFIWFISHVDIPKKSLIIMGVEDLERRW